MVTVIVYTVLGTTIDVDMKDVSTSSKNGDSGVNPKSTLPSDSASVKGATG